MNIADPSDLSQEVFKIRPLRESGQLRAIIQPYVEETLDPGLLQRGEELFRCLLREANRKQFSHGEPPLFDFFLGKNLPFQPTFGIDPGRRGTSLS